MKVFLKRILILVLITVAIVALSLGVYHKIMNIQEQMCWDILEDSADAVNNEIQIKISDNINILRLVSGAMTQEERIHSPEDILAHINSFYKMTMFKRIDILYADNTVLLQTGDMIDAPQSMDFSSIAQSGEHISDRTEDIVDASPVIRYYVPVVEDEETLAFLVGVIDCTALPEYFKTQVYQGEAYRCLVDRSDGSFLLDNWHDTLGNMYEMKPRTVKKGYEGMDLREEVKAGNTGTIAYASAVNGETSYMYYTPAGIFDWQLLIVAQEDVVFAGRIEIQRILFAVGSFELIALFAFYIWNLYNIAKTIKLSETDSLTRLYNRSKFNQIREKYLEQPPKTLGIVFFDINGLKRTNDTAGHIQGDTLIKTIAKCVGTAFGKNAYRIGGDEFVAIVPGVSREELGRRIAEATRLVEKEGYSVSFGVSWRSGDCNFTEQLRESDFRMYEQKTAHKRVGDEVGHPL